MGIKISELTAGTEPDGTETVAAVQSSASVSLTVQQIAEAVQELTYAKRHAFGDISLGDVDA